MIIEICCESLEYALQAADAGATRIELCRGLALGGLTPSPLEVKAIKKQSDVVVMALVRPRAGGFHYTQVEKELILDEIDELLAAGADGVVVGGLNLDSTIDRPFLKDCVEAAKGKSVTFHRAFDFVPNPIESLQVLIDHGVTTLLTSGQQPSALAGINLIKELINAAQGGIAIMPGAGITSRNVVEFLEIDGLAHLHSSCKKTLAGSPTPLSTESYVLDSIELKDMLRLLK